MASLEWVKLSECFLFDCVPAECGYLINRARSRDCPDWLFLHLGKRQVMMGRVDLSVKSLLLELSDESDLNSNQIIAVVFGIVAVLLAAVNIWQAHRLVRAHGKYGPTRTLVLALICVVSDQSHRTTYQMMNGNVS